MDKAAPYTWIIVVTLSILLVACPDTGGDDGGTSPQPSATPFTSGTPTPTQPPGPTPSATPESTLNPTATPLPNPTPTPVAATPTAVPVVTPTSQPEPTPTPLPMTTPTPVPAPTPTSTPVPTPTPVPQPVDLDGDGFPDDQDCNDQDPAVYPGAPEVPCDGVDNDCDGSDLTDADGDGHDCLESGGDDCDDTNPAIHPGAEEVCNDADDDCNDLIDDGLMTDWYLDDDGDGYGAGSATQACAQPASYVANEDDCDDANPAIHPGAQESCDGEDNDCDGTIDEDAIDTTTWFADTDGDGFGDPDSTLDACTMPAGYVLDATDCDDTNADINQNAQETCDGLDDNCDGTPDNDAIDATTYYVDNDGDGWGDTAVSADACTAPDGWVEFSGDCDETDPAIHPGEEERCDGLDNDCNGEVDDGIGDGEVLISMDNSTVYQVDPTTGAVSTMATIQDMSAGTRSMAVRDDGTVFFQNRADLKLYRIDPCTGTTALVGAMGTGSVGGLSFGPDGYMYGLEDGTDHLWRVDPDTGQGTLIGPIGINVGANGLAYDCTTDQLVGLDATSKALFTLDTTTGQARDFVYTTISYSAVGIEYYPGHKTFLVSNGNSLYEVDPITGEATKIGPHNGGSIDDLAFYPVCPR